jgi:hypothetical protein
MRTPAQDAFGEGFSALAEIHGQLWIFGGASFAGVASPLKTDDSRMPGAGDRLLELQVATVSLPTPAPRRGDDLMREGKAYHVTRLPDADTSTGITTFVVAVP